MGRTSADHEEDRSKAGRLGVRQDQNEDKSVRGKNEPFRVRHGILRELWRAGRKPGRRGEGQVLHTRGRRESSPDGIM